MPNVLKGPETSILYYDFRRIPTTKPDRPPTHFVDSCNAWDKLRMLEAMPNVLKDSETAIYYDFCRYPLTKFDRPPTLLVGVVEFGTNCIC